jgi:hypothetical protein
MRRKKNPIENILKDTRMTSNLQKMVRDIAEIPGVHKIVSPTYGRKTKKTGIEFFSESNNGYALQNNQFGLLIGDPQARASLKVIVCSKENHYNLVKSQIQDMPYFAQEKDAMIDNDARFEVYDMKQNQIKEINKMKKSCLIDDLLTMYLTQFINSYQVEKIETGKIIQVDRKHEPGLYNLNRNKSEMNFNLFGQSMFVGLETKLLANDKKGDQLYSSLNHFNKTKNIDYFM